MDFCDLGHDAEELDRRMALTRAGKRNTEPQERDAAGRVVCLECGEVIPPGRLKAVPEAVRCVACQTEHDRRQ